MMKTVILTNLNFHYMKITSSGNSILQVIKLTYSNKMSH